MTNGAHVPARAPRRETGAARRTADSRCGTVVKVHGRTFTPHALNRCGQMHVDLVEVVEILESPERSYPSGGTFSSPRRVAAGKGLAVVFGESDGAVITVLWDGEEKR